MATTITIYSSDRNRYYTVTVDIATSVIDRINGAPSDGDIDYYLKISTTLTRSVDNSAFPTYVVRTLADVPPFATSPALTFTELVDDYIQYFVDQAELGMSSSSSSDSSSSSSHGYSTSSSSSSMAYSLSSSSSDSSSSETSESSTSVSSESLSSDSSSSSSESYGLGNGNV